MANIIANFIFEVTTENAYRGMMSRLPGPDSGINVRIENVGKPSNCAVYQLKDDNNGHQRNGRKPANGKPSIAEIIIAAYSNVEEFAYSDASKRVQVEGGYGELSVGSALTRMQQKKKVARLGGGRWKVINAGRTA